jgi:hypothetical protein
MKRKAIFKIVILLLITFMGQSCKRYTYECYSRNIHDTSFLQQEKIIQKKMTVSQAQRYEAKHADANNRTYCQIIY